MSVRAVTLHSLTDTTALAAELAPQLDNQIVFLMGTLGSGKTTFVRHLVSRLPGGENAEIASPSFTLCNIYPTTPKVMHYDLYRLPPGGYDESLEEAIDAIENPGPGCKPVCLLIEWAENMPEILIPENRLEIYWHVQPENPREVVLRGVGSAANLPILQARQPGV